MPIWLCKRVIQGFKEKRQQAGDTVRPVQHRQAGATNPGMGLIRPKTVKADKFRRLEVINDELLINNWFRRSVLCLFKMNS